MTGPGQKPPSATLRRLRKAARLSNAVVAQRLGTSTRRTSDLETGKRVPREAEAGALSGLYQASRAARRQLAQVARDLRDEPPPARASRVGILASKLIQRVVHVF
jgi:transcriptional regulator with XRE-family HTH domain